MVEKLSRHIALWLIKSGILENDDIDLYIYAIQYLLLRLNLSRGFSAKYNVFENRVQNIRRADSPQRLRIIGSKVFFYL